MNGEDTGYLIF